MPGHACRYRVPVLARAVAEPLIRSILGKTGGSASQLPLRRGPADPQCANKSVVHARSSLTGTGAIPDRKKTTTGGSGVIT